MPQRTLLHVTTRKGKIRQQQQQQRQGNEENLQQQRTMKKLQDKVGDRKSGV